MALRDAYGYTREETLQTIHDMVDIWITHYYEIEAGIDDMCTRLHMHLFVAGFHA